jgi:hypothetical protein
MVEQLFGSKTRVKLLQLFYSNPNRSFYVREITRKIDEQINSVRRELANLLSIGIISSDATNNRLYYEVNQKYKHYAPLAMIFGGAGAPVEVKAPTKGKKEKDVVEPEPKKVKVPVVEENPTVKKLQTAGRVSLALLTGQFTRDELSGIDLLVVGDVNAAKLATAVADIEKDEGKEVRYAVMSVKDFEYRRQITDRFITNVLEAKKQVIINDNLLSE